MRAGFAIGRFGMKIVFQRVTHAPVRVDNQVIGKMGRGSSCACGCWEYGYQGDC